MCGIVGTATTGSSPAIAHIERGLEALHHRGPEASQAVEFRTDNAAAILGHTRLRIIDLDERADQPLSNEDATVHVVFNGEIYNFVELRDQLVDRGHRFDTQTDTEVLVHLYEDVDGDAELLLSKLRGMFAFALFDATRGRLLLARDRLGIKPMYYAHINDGVAFASEATALVRAGQVHAAPDTMSIVGYLLWGSVQGSRTIFSGIDELPPGSYLTWSGSDPDLRTWWQPSFGQRISDADAREELRVALEDAIARHLVADREVGLFLSGGIDSGSIATIAAGLGPIRSLTVTYPDVGGDEGAEAAAVAASLGLRHQEVGVAGADVASAIPSIAAAMDQPTHDGVNSWVVSKAAHDVGLVVALSGVGGDELFGGYPSFHLVPRVRVAAQAGRWAPIGARRRLADVLSRRTPGLPTSRVLMAPSGTGGAYRAVRGLFGVRDLERLGALRWVGESDAIEMFTPKARELSDDGDNVALLEIQRYLRNQLLRDTDAMSMAHSLEVRVPLLDDRVVDTATGIASSVRNGSSKQLLLSAAGFRRQGPKRGFTLPFDDWMRGPLRAPLRELVLSDDLPLAWLFDRPGRVALWRAFDGGHVHWSRPWAVGVLRLWAAEHGYRW